MRLTVPGCSRLWLSAQENEPKPWEGRAACVTCPIGATNSGRQISPVAEDVAILSKICPRCMRLSDRLIKGLRCVSCYNRQAEADKGRNAKGGMPRLCSTLHHTSFAVASGGTTRYVQHAGVTSLVEAILTVSKHATDVTAFGLPRVTGFEGRATRQMEFGLRFDVDRFGMFGARRARHTALRLSPAMAHLAAFQTLPIVQMEFSL